MGEPSGEWEIEENSAEANCGKVRWIMNKGLTIGKKVLVTGMVISSAPILLPPLVVISAIGFALSVPSGVVLASYACSEKLMSKLLPYSTPPLLWENGTLMSNNEEQEQDEEQGTLVGPNIDIEKEEGWGSGDILEGGKMIIQLVEKETDQDVELGKVEEGDEYGQEGVKNNGQDYVTEVVVETVEENGYGEDFSESTDLEEMPLLDNMNGVTTDGLSENYKDDTLLDENPVSEAYGSVSNVIEGDKEIGLTPIEVTTVVIEESEDQERASDPLEEEELVEEARGLLEKIRDEGNADKVMEMEKQFVAEIEGDKEVTQVRDQKPGGDAAEIEISVEDKIADIGLEKPSGNPEGGVGQIPKEYEDMQECQEMKYVNDVNTGYEDIKPPGDIGSVLESENANNNLEAEKPIGETKNVDNISEAEIPMAETRDLRLVVSGIVENKQKPVISKAEIVLQGGRAEENMNDLDVQLVREKETVVSTNSDAREIADESGLHLFDEKNVSGQYWHASYETSEGHVADEGTDFAELPVSRSAHESTDAEISSGKDFSMHSNELQVQYDEAKIWRQIDAMRRIVGYKRTPHATYIEELKALYLFTGVEPPASFDDHPDLAQVNNKLRFLMSIIGVKVN